MPKKKQNSLLNKALNHKITRKEKLDITDEIVELAIAWAENRIGIVQVARALGNHQHPMNAYPTLARALRQAWGKKKK